MKVEREALYRAQELALAVISASETPKWLAEKAWRAYWDLNFDLAWNDRCSETWESRSGLLLWPGAYWYQVEQLLANLPDEIKASHPADVMVARNLTETVDNHGCSVDMRLESVTSLRRTINRLLQAVAESCTESFASMLTDENLVLLGHLARIDPAGDDDDEIDDDSEQFERSTNL